jgi:ABC-type long-subunit fatty acid transport system fused permease/ATPase subunit
MQTLTKRLYFGYMFFKHKRLIGPTHILVFVILVFPPLVCVDQITIFYLLK